MRFTLLASLLVLLLCTCGPAQGSEQLRKREELFNSAYERLDAAILERLLAEDFTATYARPPVTKDKTRFLGELAELRTIFPNLRLRVDSLEIDPAELGLTTGLRTFFWTYAGEPGSYRERFRNHWRQVDGEWLLTSSDVRSPDTE